MKLKNTQPAVILSFLFIFLACSLFALADDSAYQNKALFRDADEDGLSDGEEKIYGTDPNKADTDNDGYSDGVEVKSGYDPLKPAPGDKIIQASDSAVLGESTDENASEEKNMTSRLSDKLADFIQENEGKKGSVSVENLDAIVSESLGDEINQDLSATIDESRIRVKKQDYGSLTEAERSPKEKEDAVAYFKSVLYVLVNNAPGEITSEEDLNVVFDEFSSNFNSKISASDGYDPEYFPDLLERGKIVLEQMYLIEVPENILILHKEGLLFLAQALALDKLTIDPEDSVGIIVNLSKIQEVIDQGVAFQENFSLKMDEYGIERGADLVFEK